MTTLEKPATMKHKRTFWVAGISALVLICIIVSYFKVSSKAELATPVSSDRQFYDLILEVNGMEQPYIVLDTEVTQMASAAMQVCDDLKHGKRLEFQSIITYNDYNRSIATGAVLAACVGQQDQAKEWGLTDEDFERFPLR